MSGTRDQRHSTTMIGHDDIIGVARSGRDGRGLPRPRPAARPRCRADAPARFNGLPFTNLTPTQKVSTSVTVLTEEIISALSKVRAAATGPRIECRCACAHPQGREDRGGGVRRPDLGDS